MGDEEGEVIDDRVRYITPILLDTEIKNEYDKMRIIALYAMTNNGIAEETLSKLAKHAQVKRKHIIANLQYLGVNIISDVSVEGFKGNGQRLGFQGSNRSQPHSLPRKERIIEQTYRMSRWTPIIKDIMEDCIEDKLDVTRFPFLSRRVQCSGYAALAR